MNEGACFAGSHWKDVATHCRDLWCRCILGPFSQSKVMTAQHHVFAMFLPQGIHYPRQGAAVFVWNSRAPEGVKQTLEKIGLSAGQLMSRTSIGCRSWLWWGPELRLGSPGT